MKNASKYLGLSLVVISIILALFDFLLENKEILFIIGVILIVSSYFIIEKK
tara:strand:- start:3886 stop:4038 length:153 start_codon:yes stop_codon:yes gene_type:complete